ncbi:hypothetical protein SAMN02745121_03027 [Nannocystis exedens]|uniref:Uncharacterized protein n=1 Tax=Nannocystis exedens TaxID=54 RepID=A0A1I1XRQ6_9BACT|nr:hypothetical protein [Nannocystis exedens]PCC73246.1 hypothetical protein NAEX_06334 [Nannocystis exedens]SFE09931.1 hypothetical protein SAMN02745121_03027 [Nannocystis exedens]
MKASTFLAFGAVTLGLFGYTLCQLAGRTPTRERPAEVARAAAAKKSGDDGPRAYRDPRDERDARDTLAIALRSRLERALEAPEEPPPLPAPNDRLEAETAFEVVMDKIEGLADKGDAVSKRRRKRLYRAANDAFAALSNHLDGQNPHDLAALEQAHVRLKVMLREIDAGPPGS